MQWLEGNGWASCAFAGTQEQGPKQGIEGEQKKTFVRAMWAPYCAFHNEILVSGRGAREVKAFRKTKGEREFKPLLPLLR